MPHLSGIKKAHRRRRVVERGQKIGFDVIDLCRGCPQAVQNVGDVHLVQLAEPLLDDPNGDLLFSQPDGISGAALDFRDQLHQRVHILSGILRAEVSIILSPETFLIVLPGDAHKLKMQLDAPSPVTKSVFKVRVK